MIGLSNSVGTSLLAAAAVSVFANLICLIGILDNDKALATVGAIVALIVSWMGMLVLVIAYVRAYKRR